MQACFFFPSSTSECDEEGRVGTIKGPCFEAIGGEREDDAEEVPRAVRDKKGRLRLAPTGLCGEIPVARDG